MLNTKIRIAVTLLMLMFAGNTETVACSMYKVTAHGKTMVGNNEDSWGRDPQIWFVPGKEGKAGVACVGYARKKPIPDGAMNEYGLSFDAFSMYHRGNLPPRDNNKKDFSYATILSIMQDCRTVDEVYAYLNNLNLHVLDGSQLFHGAMLLFVDKSGKYLVVEAHQMKLGNDNTFALANFSFTDTRDLKSISIERYRKGMAFMENKMPDTTLNYCINLSDTMSVNRPKLGDGTLYTNIFDPENGLIYLYFYHDYSRSVSFNLKDELAKGEHGYLMANLFPDNAGFQKFLHYITPQNNTYMMALLAFCGLLFIFTFMYFTYIRLRRRQPLRTGLQYFLLGAGFVYAVYVYILLSNEGIFYFKAPYQTDHSWLITVSSYLPVVLLMAMIPFAWATRNVIKHKEWNLFSRFVLMANAFSYSLLIALFAYWELYSL